MNDVLMKPKEHVWKTVLLLLAAIVASFAAVVFTAYDPEFLVMDFDAATLRRFVRLPGEIGAVHTLAFAGVFLLFRRNLKGKTDLRALILSCCFSLFLSVGLSYRLFTDATFFFASKKQFLFALFLTGGNALVLYTLLKELFRAADGMRSAAPDGTGTTGERKTFFLVAGLLLLCWLPFELGFFPGSVPYDGRKQLLIYDGVVELTNDHPYFATYFFGALYRLGERVFGDNAVFAIVLCQNLAAAAVFSGVCVFLRKLCGSKTVFVCSVLFYALVPVFWAYAQSVIKDTLFFVCFTWLLLEAARILFSKEPVGKGTYFRLETAAVLTAVFRNNGFPIALLLLLALILGAPKLRRRAVLLSGACIVVVSVFATAAVPAYLRIPEANPFESLSIPIQQVARCVTVHGEEMTAEEKEAVEALMPAELFRNYKPGISDPVKGELKSRVASPDGAFRTLWLRCLQRYPATCADAFMNHVYGWIDPFYVTGDQGQYQFHIREAFERTNPAFKDSGYVYSAYVFPETLRLLSKNVAELANRVPFVQLLCMPGIWFWAALTALAGALAARDKKGVLFLVPVLVYHIGCFFSPVNGCLRYVLPLIAAAPLTVGCVLLRHADGGTVPEAGEEYRGSLLGTPLRTLGFVLALGLFVFAAGRGRAVTPHTESPAPAAQTETR
ncbi:MAG: DUF6020 family protein [Clostridia bacterium]|nr:DUF6020 family protein [Clostridia bacterium]